MPETELFEEARKKADLTLIEADGARHLPCKAPAEHEPALLSSSDLPPVPVCDGAGDIWNAALSETPYIKRDEAFVNKKILLKQGEHFQVQYEYEKTLTAPVRNGQKIGEIRYYLDDTLYYKESIHVPDSIDAITLPYCIRQSIRHFLLYTST